MFFAWRMGRGGVVVMAGSPVAVVMMVSAAIVGKTFGRRFVVVLVECREQDGRAEGENGGRDGERLRARAKGA